ncbi:hypothetical protein ACIBO2_34455 [Nonomuraea sp. NPDC050022]|uniref:hypothetical protein n=1 Tax=Nonomuraea sp. NPDC050022 TaxID=3364358 RepID=UPI0037B49725
MRLGYTPAELLVTVTNAPPPRRAVTRQQVGLRERVELLGGELSASWAPDGGFTLTACIPARDGDAADHPHPRSRRRRRVIRVLIVGGAAASLSF